MPPPFSDAPSDREDAQRASERQKLKTALYYDIVKTIEKEASDRDVQVSIRTASALAELALHFTENLGSDLEHFARHAKRTTVLPDDVVLFARKSPVVRARLEALRSTIEEQKPDKPRKRRKKSAAGQEKAPESSEGQ